ncbi:pro-resilin-like [Eriocheir sinensis]|uniref:pro-resilin-like n=1 Tax=Eriocheir sinensis TaxID=95602 RepID=UPI0021C6A04A|nr:pro-resilin-like [Eriocheir sinensis]
MVSKVFFVLVAAAAVAVVAADERPLYTYGSDSEESSEESYSVESYESTEAKYNFNWAVKDAPSANDFGQAEERDNEETKGSYYVQLPDGRLQEVTYYVDGDSGYIAEVNYVGEASYPESDESSEESFESYESYERR